ncbi:glycerophosphodiester phosphodiesterase family protein [Kineococcus indalonis]|uniref:glycerophosphodiester phosphodiesterase family protein n=1 Tax=Kineococcus indalonis TaxID=2696566 RepID=UPI0014134F83|nr:glycerophosphodiester phosphodiesterase family protein [Kineococcus indalonis]NAZ87503.1 glycerophosphodiester phosphodiesterase [Kineococcus indalonis]
MPTPPPAPPGGAPVRAAVPRPPARHAFCEHPGPLAIAHRGFSLDGRENTLAAFEAAVRLGYRYLETDVRATADGRLVAFHDEQLDRVSDVSGRLADLPWSVVRAARVGTGPGAGEAVPLLEDVLGAFPRARFNVDVKSAAALAGIGEVLRRTGAHERVLLTSFGERRRRAALAAAGTGPGGAAPATSASLPRTAAALLGVRLGAPALVRTALGAGARGDGGGAVDALQVPVRHGGLSVVSQGFVDAAHRAGAQVHVWTVDDPAQVHALLDLGVDGIITDRADLLREALRARGQWVGA